MRGTDGPPTGRIAAAFARARAAGRPALIPYVTAGDPDLGTTTAVVHALARGGADVIEIGVPFSDPIADGPVIQRATERALRNGVGLRSVLRWMAGIAGEGGIPPFVLFTYYNPVHRMGLEAFAAEAAAAGASGVLVTDLPPEEAIDLKTLLDARDIDLIFLLSPTSARERVDLVLREGRGFLYIISRTGVTGERADLPPGLEEQVRAARARSRLPVVIGFGISRPAQVRAAAGFADGVVVGSALVRLIEETGPSSELPARVEAFCRDLAGG